MTEKYIISRKDAKSQGLTRYFTGIPCKYSHISERYVVNGLCIECQAIARNSEKNRSYQRDWIVKKKKENPEISEILKIKMREKRANPDSGIKKYEKEYRENNKQRERERIYAWRENNKEMVKAAAYGFILCQR